MAADVNTLVEDNLKLVPFVVHRYLGGFVNRYGFDDLVGCGNIGLVKAAQRFNPKYGVKFATYAIPMIYGEIRRFLRDSSTTIKFTRSIKELYHRIVRAKLLYGTPEHTAGILGVGVADVLDALAYGSNHVLLSTDEPVYTGKDGGVVLRGETLGYEQDFDFGLMVNDICTLLGQRNGLVFRRYYLEDCSQHEVAAEVGVSQVQVSRILKAIKTKVKERVKG